ncbi:MAG: ATP-binding protein, partial [Spirulina sp. SIO3F2]|nr:ATP-binding protein [Spirulina sp. SIO3F2]
MSNNADANVQIEQTVTGSNQGTIIGSISGGVVIIYGNHIQKPEDIDPIQKLEDIGSEAVKNPYKGLLAFHEQDHNRFFGRYTEIQTLWQEFWRLHEPDPDGKYRRFLPIYGPSGSGKSSLARAGLLPKLQESLNGELQQLQIAVLTPGEKPIQELATVLLKTSAEDKLSVAKLAEWEETLNRPDTAGEYNGLQRIASLLPDIENRPLVLLIDQFEEIYSMCKEQNLRDAFIGNLLYAAKDRRCNVSVIITMRSDFLRETQQQPALNYLFSAQGFLVPVMQTAGLWAAIAEPAKKANQPLEPDIVQRLVDETKQREGALPLLQFTLMEIWEGLQQDKDPMTTLQQLGGVGGALGKKAQKVYEDLDSSKKASEKDSEKDIAKRLFLELVTLREGTEDTRRRVRLEHLRRDKNDDLQKVRCVVEKFARQDIRVISMTADDQQHQILEISHEALLQNWNLLQRWVEEDRDFLRQKRQIETSADSWQENSRNKGYLLQGSPLKEALHFQKQKTTKFPLSESAKEFIQASIKYRIRNRVKLANLLLIPVFLFGGIAVRYFRLSTISKIEALISFSEESLESNQNLESLLLLIEAGYKQKKNSINVSGNSYNTLKKNLIRSLSYLTEYNRFNGHSGGITDVVFSNS